MVNASLVHHQLAHLLVICSACLGETLGAQGPSSGFLLLYSIFNRNPETHFLPPLPRHLTSPGLSFLIGIADQSDGRTFPTGLS